MRPYNTLFMLMSADGKISTGSNDHMDMDKDLPNIAGVKEGLHQYYEIEQTQGLWYFNTGRTMAKVGNNEKDLSNHSWGINFVLLDNSHLTEHGIEYFCSISDKLIIVTSNINHPAFKILNNNNLNIMYYKELNLKKMMKDLYVKFGCKSMCLQSGSTLNALLVKNKLIDELDIVVCPILIGGKDTVSLIGGESFVSSSDLNQAAVLKLDKAEILKDSYLRLRYKVINSEE